MVGPYTRYGPPLTSERPARLGGAFAAGENTRSLLDEIGFSTPEIDALLAKGIVAEAASDSSG
jgi:hypothetical protein